MKNSKEYDNFEKLIDRVLAVPHSVIKQRVEEHQKRAAKNPNKRGPKPKTSARASNDRD